jgi:hypothetical protein
MSDHKGSVALATATLMDIIARGKEMQAHGVRGTGQADVEATRADAHSLLDAYLDQMSDAGAHVRAIIET